MDKIPILTFEEAYERGSGWLAGGLKEIAYSSPVDVIEQEFWLTEYGMMVPIASDGVAEPIDNAVKARIAVQIGDAGHLSLTGPGVRIFETREAAAAVAKIVCPAYEEPFDAELDLRRPGVVEIRREKDTLFVRPMELLEGGRLSEVLDFL